MKEKFRRRERNEEMQENITLIAHLSDVPHFSDIRLAVMSLCDRMLMTCVAFQLPQLSKKH